VIDLILFRIKSLVCKECSSQGFYYSEVLQRFCTSYKSEESVPCQPSWRPCCGSPDSNLSTVPSVWTTYHTVWTPDRSSIIRPDDMLFLSGPFTASRSFCSSFHLSGRISSPSGRLSVFDQASDSFHVQLWEDWCNRPDDVDSHPDVLLLKARIVIQIQPSGRAFNRYGIANSTSTVRTLAFHGPDARTVNMEIACWRLTVRMAIPPGSGRAKALYENYLQRTCDHLDDNASPSGRGCQTEKIFSENLKNSGRTVVCPDDVCTYYCSRSFEPLSYK